MKKILAFSLIPIVSVFIVQMIDNYANNYNLIDTYSCIENRTINYSQPLSDSIILCQRNWDSYLQNDHCLKYSVAQQKRITSRDKMYGSHIYTNNYIAYYGNVYQRAYLQDRKSLSALEDSLQNLALENTLNRKEFAELIVSFVQDIPYQYVMQDEPCPDNNTPCQRGVKYGLRTPLDFLYTLNGDCDTRCVLLYTILKNLGYDAAILISKQYAHAMLAINLPYPGGEYISHLGKKYYFWETTAKFWKPGVLPQSSKNINYWQVALN